MPKKTKSSTSSVRSPAPKDLKRKKSNGKIIFFGLILSVGLIMLACFLDYQQSKLVNHTSRLPHEVQVATKYVVDLANKVPHKLEVLIDSAKGQMIVITGNMHIGDKTVAQLLFGVDEDEEDPTPADVIKDFELEDEVEDLVDEKLNTVNDAQILEEVEVEEIATLLRKEDEMRVYEENRRKMKEETLKAMEAKKEAIKSALIEEKEKVKVKTDEVSSRKALDEDEREHGQINDKVYMEATDTQSKVAENYDNEWKSVKGTDGTTFESKKFKEDEAF